MYVKYLVYLLFHYDHLYYSVTLFSHSPPVPVFVPPDPSGMSRLSMTEADWFDACDEILT